SDNVGKKIQVGGKAAGHEALVQLVGGAVDAGAEHGQQPGQPWTRPALPGANRAIQEQPEDAVDRTMGELVVLPELARGHALRRDRRQREDERAVKDHGQPGHDAPGSGARRLPGYIFHLPNASSLMSARSASSRPRRARAPSTRQ